MTITLLEQAELANYTTLKIGGRTRYLVEANTLADLAGAVAFAKDKQLPIFVLGGGSNVLVLDGEYPGVVIHINNRGRQYEMFDQETVRATIAAGESLDDVIAETVGHGWWGLENLSSIPGSVGAAPVQNVGAYGVEAANCIESVTVFDTETASTKVLSAADCAFGYRDSIFKQPAGRHYIVTTVTFRLSITPQPRLHYADLANYFTDQTPSLYEIRQAIIGIRREKFPDWKVVGTAGSFFKNPIISETAALALLEKYPQLPTYEAGVGQRKVSLGFILDKVCGLKGYGSDEVCLYEKQALVLVVRPHLATEKVINFINDVTEKVKIKTAIEIEWEVVKLQTKEK